jgi:CRP/FNR family transcriptional regulator, cyclic AMP receptor protein
VTYRHIRRHNAAQMSDTEMLAEVPLFALLDDNERAFLAERVQSVKYAEGDVIFAFGDPGDAMYILKSGQVEVSFKNKTGQTVVLEKPEAGDFFGEISLLDEGPRTATAKALTDVEAIEVDRDDLDELFKLKPAAALDLLAATGRRLRATSMLLRNAASRNVNEEIEDKRTTVMKVADWIADFSGSLPFLFIHLAFFAFWLGWNTLLKEKQFDGYPFGFLTLVVSLEAIILSVFVLLSQNRQVEREKVRGDIEYDVNLKAEMQIAHMHEKVDNLYSEVQRRLDRIEKRVTGAPGGGPGASLRPPAP